MLPTPRNLPVSQSHPTPQVLERWSLLHNLNSRTPTAWNAHNSRSSVVEGPLLRLPARVRISSRLFSGTDCDDPRTDPRMKQEDTSNALEEGKYAAPLRLPRPEQKYAKKDGASWRNMKLLFCFLGLQVSYVLWGLAQEYLMTKTYSAGKFKSSAFCVFGNRFLALLISLGIVMFRRFTAPKPITEAPYYYYAPSSLSNTLSSWAQYESLKYISFPTQVLAKSCKIIPVMLVGILLNKKTYPTRDYIESFLITLGVTMFSISERNSPTEPHDDSSYGFMLLALYLACDSFTSQWQSRVYKQYHVDQYQMMLGVNVWSMLMTGFTLYQSGEFFTSFAFILADPQALLHMVVLSITSATGQLFIFYTIKEFGPVTFTIMMTVRQVLSLFLSLLLFGHSIGAMGWASITAVFFVVFSRLYNGSKD